MLEEEIFISNYYHTYTTRFISTSGTGNTSRAIIWAYLGQGYD